jgi:hypothetical protein
MKLRLAALVAATAALAAGMPNANAVSPQISDPAGDVKGAQAAYDIVSVRFDTTKVVTSTVVKKKKVKVVTLKDFTITMTLAGDANVLPGTSYQVIADNTPCGTLYAFTYFSALDAGPGNSLQFGHCGEVTPQGDSALLDPTVTVAGKTITWSVPMKTLPPQVKAGSAISGMYAYTAPTEPVVGFSGVDFLSIAGPEAAEAATFDYAATDKVYKVGS